MSNKKEATVIITIVGNVVGVEILQPESSETVSAAEIIGALEIMKFRFINDGTKTRKRK